MLTFTHQTLPKLAPLAIAAMLTLSGCSSNENTRLAEMADRHLQQQVQQNRRMAQLQGEVAAGSRQLVQADARARQEIAALQRLIQSQSGNVDRQRERLDAERRDLAAQQRWDPLLATAITNLGLLAAALLPLVLCWYLLRRPLEPDDDRAVAELFLDDVVADRPLLSPDTERSDRLPHDRPPSSRISLQPRNDSDSDDPAAPSSTL